ncbi:MAG: long-chain acyl-CoA synthetase [Actinomycetota bacterium]|jgi:long-chain acyl-CoA synthetase|nr:long-chain acyl-CoA synthetase [Actinomycetota bacterium]
MTDHRPWFTTWREGVPKTLEPYPDVSLFSLLADAAAAFPESPALAFFGKHISYRALLAEVERFSAVLAGLGVKKGDRVGLLLPNCPQYVIAYYAAVRLGAVAVGNNPLYTARELTHQVKDSAPHVMVILDQLYPQWAAVATESKVPQIVVTKLTDYMKFPLNVLAPIKFKKDAKHEGKPWPPIPAGTPVQRWKALMKAAGTAPPVSVVDAHRDPAVFVYTGGTTGVSKGAMLSHHNIVSNVLQVAPCITGFERGNDGVMCILPFFHSFGMVAMNFGISQAGKLVMIPRFELGMALKAMSKERPSFFPGVPRLFVALNEAPDIAKYDLKSVKASISGAAPLPAAVSHKFNEVTGGAKLVEGYGLTECSPVTHVNPFTAPHHGTIGIPLPDTDCKIVHLDDPDREVPIGERGELCIKGPQVMLGYWGKPEATTEMIRNGWLHTGDIAVMDAEGFFQIVDRMKDMILVSGFNVYPTEVEEVLNGHPKVQKVCVVGLPDDTTGERVKAYIVTVPGEHLTAEELNAWSRDPEQGLAGYRVPKEWEFRDSLPETLIGKVLRRVLQEEERQKTAASTPS